MNKFIRFALCGILSQGAARAAQAQGPDPFAGNNTVYPAAKDWPRDSGKGSFRTSNYNYPVRPIVSKWLPIRPAVALTKATAPAYVAAVKKFIERQMSGLVNDPLQWTPQHRPWLPALS